MAQLALILIATLAFTTLAERFRPPAALVHPLDLSEFPPLPAAMFELGSRLWVSPFAVGTTCILQGILGWLVLRVSSRPGSPTFASFVRRWWRAVLLLGPLYPACAYILSHATGLEHALFISQLAPWLAIALAPSVFRDGPRHVRRARWRPVCPECGYSVHNAPQPRCAECGYPYPTESRTYRRWAIHRLDWDRRRRTLLPVAYGRTWLAIAFCPCRAAWRLASPDRFGRAFRWGLGHLLLAAVLGSLLGSHQYYWRVLVYQWFGIWYSMPTYSAGESAPPLAVLQWAGESAAAWLVVLGFLPLLASAIAWVLPASGAARAAAAKWALYACAILPAALLLMAAYDGIMVARAAPAPLPPLLSFVWPRLRVLPIAAAYALWWSAGPACSPWLSQRGLLLRAWYAGVFMLLWVLCAYVLFPSEGLEGML